MPSATTNGDAPTNGHTALTFVNTVDGKSRTTQDHHQVINPRTEETLWDAPLGTTQDLEEAVEAANRAFKTWRFTTQEERSKVLLDLAQVVKDNLEVLTDIVMKETGKSKAMSHVDVEKASSHFEYYTKVTLEDEVQWEDDEVKIITTHAPIGVLAAISPWNFPLLLSNIKVASALATGNCVIIKPSPFTPYSLLKFCELAQSVLPPGVFQAVNGGADIGEAMTLHPGIHHISFTGTIAVGRRILQACTKTMKKVILELAGNDACIVCEDADLDKIVPYVALGCFFHAGQVCVSSKRVYVHESIYDRFLEKFVEESKKFQINDADFNLFSPLSNKANYERSKSFLEDSKKNNHNIVAGGEVDTGKKGFWIQPTVVSKPPEDSLIVQEEQFGPIAPVLSWSDEADVIARANLENAGLGASIFTPDLDRARKLASQLEAGSVWINMYERPHHAGYFCGWKLSGMGGELGKQGLLNYSQIKTLHHYK